jgi:CHASE2 domain-containing sensor protein/predicted Ser/Thr protein kinase
VKERFWSKDWFAALAFALTFVVLAHVVFSDSFQGLERYAYDLGVRARERAPSDKVAVIAIDEQSIRNLGRWPWPRNLHAAMLDLLREGGARAVGNTIFYFEAQEDPGLRYINEIAELIDKTTLAELRLPAPPTIPAATAAPVPAPARPAMTPTQERYGKDIGAIEQKIAEARTTLSVDRALAETLAKGPPNVLAMTFAALGTPQGRPDEPLPEHVRKSALTKVVDNVNAVSNGWLPVPTQEGVSVPLPELGRAAAGIGHLNQLVDVDGASRFEALALKHFDEYYPSLALLLAAQALNLKPADIELRLGEGVAMGGVNIATRPDLLMYNHFYGARDGRAPFPIDSFYDVLSGKIPANAYQGKVVLIGPTALGIADSFATPVNPSMRPVEILAHTVSSILQQDFYTRPSWGGWLELGLLALITLYLAAVLPLLSPGLAGALTAGVAALLVFGEVALLSGSALWLKLMIPTLLLVTGHLFMTVKRLRLTEKLKLSSEAEGAESNKMLGLAFQGQGQLDMAWEKFRRVQPVDDKILDLMYNLALDFERKRQFNKAESVFQHIAQHNPKFRDVGQKTARAKKMSETVILGGSGGHPGGTMVLGGDNEKPMLGRYQVEKELGKGAMGVVYLGKDPKINRMVAIKTMALAQEFEADELANVKARFFREAETAGRLNHPNIVSIYDAGEEHDLCYIAMEFLKGHDLVRHTKANALLPVRDVVKIVADAADALDYAHQQGVVHRDIKPANLMWLTDTKTVKVTDFGIARITDSSKTKTGMVLGTPSYMSPEQLAGKKVDGRSDLFSLGVTLYQMLTGNLPFQADSMATLMFKIANEPHPQATVLRPDLPGVLNAVIDRALDKDLTRRYQRGNELAAELRAAAQALH